MNRTSLLYFALLASSALALAACDGSDGGADASVIVLMDGGRPSSDSGPACPPITVPGPSMPGCTSATADCLMAAAADGSITGAELQGCVMMDADPEACGDCVSLELLSCATMMGCDDELGQVECCLDEACPDGAQTCLSAATATGGACEADLARFNECRGGVTCSITGACFPPMMMQHRAGQPAEGWVPVAADEPAPAGSVLRALRR